MPPPIRLTHPDWLTDDGREFRRDEEKVELAIRLARENVVHDTGGPFGAAIFAVGGTRPVAVGTNGVTRLHNSVTHAEIVAIMAAELALGNESLAGHELFTSCEPCAMCLGAIHAAGLERVVDAALREDAERIGFDEGPVFAESYEYVAARGLSFVHGLRRAEAGAVLDLYAERGGPIYNG